MPSKFDSEVFKLRWWGMGMSTVQWAGGELDTIVSSDDKSRTYDEHTLFIEELLTARSTLQQIHRRMSEYSHDFSEMRTRCVTRAIGVYAVE